MVMRPRLSRESAARRANFVGNHWNGLARKTEACAIARVVCRVIVAKWWKFRVRCFFYRHQVRSWANSTRIHSSTTHVFEFRINELTQTRNLMRNVSSKIFAVLALVSAIGLVIPAQAQLLWQVGRPDGGWPAGDGGGPDTTFVQENGVQNPLPGSPVSTEVPQGAD